MNAYKCGFEIQEVTTKTQQRNNKITLTHTLFHIIVYEELYKLTYHFYLKYSIFVYWKSIEEQYISILLYHKDE